MKRAIILLSIACVALTPAERKIVLHAKSELQAAKEQRDSLKSELGFAKQSAADSASSAVTTEQRAVTAESQAKAQHDELQTCADQNAVMRPVYEQVNKWWGIGGILYGFSVLAKHLLILLAVIIVLAIVLAVVSFLVTGAFPGLGFLRSLGSRALDAFRRSNK